MVVGARSAIFAPTPHLGLIVLDEEHEASFKQESAPRYHARDVAMARATAEADAAGAGLGHAVAGELASGRSGRVSAGRDAAAGVGPAAAGGRHDRPAAAKSSGATAAGPSAGSCTRPWTTALDDGGQVILLLNRRGFSTHIQCPACGHVVRCPQCDIALTHHRTRQIAVVPLLRLRGAGRRPSVPSCDFAGHPLLRAGHAAAGGRGAGPLSRRHRCLRMDTDTMQAAAATSGRWPRSAPARCRILLGTQMIAKGLDFPNVTLVGVINADTALHLPDFRAAERTFQLVTQVAGRTGRGPQGRPGAGADVQPRSSGDPGGRAARLCRLRGRRAADPRQMLALSALCRHDPAGGPRAGRSGGPGQFGRRSGPSGCAAVERHGLEARVLGPAPAPSARLRGKYRFQLQTQAVDGAGLHEAVVQATADFKPPEDVQWIVDVDPMDML